MTDEMEKARVSPRETCIDRTDGRWNDPFDCEAFVHEGDFSVRVLQPSILIIVGGDGEAIAQWNALLRREEILVDPSSHRESDTQRLPPFIAGPSPERAVRNHQLPRDRSFFGDDVDTANW